LGLSRIATSCYFPARVRKARGRTIAEDYLIDFFNRQNFAMIKEARDYLYQGRRSQTGGAAFIHNRTEEYSAMLWSARSRASGHRHGLQQPS
jgi:hypothetical protein